MKWHCVEGPFPNGAQHHPEAPITRPFATELLESDPAMQMPGSKRMIGSNVENRIGRIDGIEAVGTGAPIIPLIAGRRTKPDAGIDAETGITDRGSAEGLHQSAYPRFPSTG